MAGHDGPHLLDFVRDFEKVRNLCARVDHVIIKTVKTAELPEALLRRSPQAVLTDLLRIPAKEAKMRADAAAMVGRRVSALGEELSPQRERLAQATAGGDIAPPTSPR